MQSELGVGRCLLTVIVVFFNMRREATRTLCTLSSSYQAGVEPHQYKVIAIDNGSSDPLDAEMVKSFGANFEYIFFDTKSMSPAAALNYGIQKADTPYVMVMIDGARMVSPGLIKRTLEAFDAFKNPFVYTVSLHLGNKSQNVSMLEGYNQQVEDALLETIDWKSNGYELFSVSNVENNLFHFFGRMPESNCFALRADSLKTIGGFDERFQASGGGLVNLEIFARYVHHASITPVALIGEATFHQFHGGVSTNVRRKEHPLPAYQEEYRRLFGEEYMPPQYHPFYWGKFDESNTGLVPGSTFRLYLKIARMFIENNKTVEAKALLQFILPIDETDPEVHDALGSLHLKLGDFGGAERSYQAAIKHDYFSKEKRHLGLGNALRMQGRLEAAIECYQIAAQGGAPSLGYLHLGQLEEQQGHADKAMSYLEKSVAADPRLYPALLALGNLYNKAGREKEAFELFKKALAVRPSDIWGNCSIATYYWRAKDIVAARKHYLRAHSTLTSTKTKISSNMYAKLGDGLQTVDELQKAKEVLELGLKSDPSHATLLSRLAHVRKRLNHQDGAGSASQKL